MIHKFDVLAGKKGAGWSQCVRARIAMAHNDSSSHVRFSNFFEDFRQTTWGVTLRIDRPTLLKWNSRLMTSFACFFHEQLSLDLARLRRPTWWNVVLFRAHTHRSMIRHRWRSYKCLWRHRERAYPTFFDINRHEPFFGRLSNCAESNENKSFLRPAVHAILNVRNGRNAQWCLYLTVCHMTTLHYQFTHGNNVLWYNGTFRRTIEEDILF